jgi:hypothetical protein
MCSASRVRERREDFLYVARESLSGRGVTAIENRTRECSGALGLASALPANLLRLPGHVCGVRAQEQQRRPGRLVRRPRPPSAVEGLRRRRLAPSKACAVVAVRRRRRAVLKVEWPLPPRRPAASKQMQQARANGFSPRLSVRRPPFTLHPSPISGLRLRRLEVVHNNHDCDSEG